MAYTAGDKHFAAERSHGPYLRSLDTLNMPLLPLECPLSLALGRPSTDRPSSFKFSHVALAVAPRSLSLRVAEGARPFPGRVPSCPIVLLSRTARHRDGDIRVSLVMRLKRLPSLAHSPRSSHDAASLARFSVTIASATTRPGSVAVTAPGHLGPRAPHLSIALLRFRPSQTGFCSSPADAIGPS